MASKYAEFAYYDENAEMQCVKYKIPLRIRIAERLCVKLFNYVNRSLLRDRRRRYTRYMRNHK